MANIPYNEIGMPSYEEGGPFSQVELYSGSTPHPVTEDFPVAATVAFEAFSVVGLSGGNLAMANGTTVMPIGITTQAVVADATNPQSVAIFRAGNFNPDALVWDAAYSTDALKAAAFRDAPTPTNILIRKRL